MVVCACAGTLSQQRQAALGMKIIGDAHGIDIVADY
jgi:hypothetical protein